MTANLLVSGMFRSGTTLLSRMVGAAPECLLVADPFVYFFKAYRNHHLERSGARGWHPDEPTSDLFLSPHRDVLRSILEADFSEEIPREVLAKLRHDIKTWKKAQHPELCKRLRQVKGKTFADVYRSLLGLCVELYGSDATRVAGAKVSWSEEFLPAMARAFDDMRFVLVVRDLRAIVASQNSKTHGRGVGKRPLLFYVRHWRKSVAFLRRLAVHDEDLRHRMHVVRYEDLVREPEETLRGVAEFSGVPFCPAMLDAAAYRGESETGVWTPNSSYDLPAEGIYTASIERWREALNDDEIATLNALAGPELALMGYDLPEHVPDPIECLGLDSEPAFEDLAHWIQPFPCAQYLRAPHSKTCEYAVESMRRSVLEGDADVPADVVRDLFLDPRVLEELRETWAARAAFA